MSEARNTLDKGNPQLWFAWYPVQTDKGRRWLTRVWWHVEHAYNNARGQGLYGVAVNRYRESPHPRVTFANDFSKRLEPQPGMKVVYARTSIDSDRDVVKKLYLGYSDDVSVFINGKILYRGRSAQNFRDPGFLGIVNPENDVVYIPLNKGRNELMLAVSELGGGWGFICRVAELENHGTDRR